MKKTIYFLCLLLGLICTSRNLNAQSAIFLSPQSQCFNPGSTIATGYLNSLMPGATNYSWSVASPSCAATVNTFSNGLMASINYPCCGIFTVNVLAWDSTFSNIVVWASQTTTVYCPVTTPVTISGNTNLCPGQSTTLTASGATTYTWNSSSGATYTGSTIVLNTPSVTTCFSVTGSAGNCSNTNFGYTCVNVNGSTVSIGGNMSICAGGSTSLYGSGGSTYTWMPGGSTNQGITVSPSVTTCYTLLSQGCSGLMSDVQCVTVTPVNIAVSAIPAGNCSSTYSLTASGAVSYTWISSSGQYYFGSPVVVSPSVSTCYTVVAWNGASCLTNSTICINVQSQPTISISGNTSICAGSGATLTASGANTYTWYTSMGTSTGSTIVLSPSATACYTVMGINSSGCTGFAAGCVNVNGGTVSIGGNATICGGGSAFLYGIGGTSYTWMPGGVISPSIVVSPSVTTCYTLYAQGCSGLTAAVKCVTVTPSIGIGITTIPNQANCPSTYSLIASGAQTYTWYSSAGQTYVGSTIVVSPGAITCYTVVGYSGNCSATGVTCASVQPQPTVSISGNTSICAGSGATLTASGANSYTWYTSMGTFTGSTIVLSPSATACYSVVGTNAFGCTGYNFGCVNVSSGGTVSIGGGNSSICPGGSTTLFATGGTSYTWMPGGINSSSIIVSPTVTTCYTVYAQTCSGLASAVKCVTVASPGIGITTIPNQANCPSSYSLIASGAQTYTWVSSAGQTYFGSIIVVTPGAITCYTVIGSNGPNCSATGVTCASVQPQPTVSISGNTSICAGSGATLTASGASSYTWYTSMGTFTGSTIVLSPSATACYSVVGTNVFGCTGYGFGCVNVSSGGTVSIGGNGSMCPGGSTTLFATGGTSYTWMPGGSTSQSIVVSPSVSTCYTLYAQTCSGLATAVKCVTVSSPGIGITTIPNQPNCPSTYSLIASGAQTYTWYSSAGQTYFGSTIVVAPGAITCYTVIGSNGPGCSGTGVTCASVQPQPTISISGNTSICAGSGATLTANGASSYTWYTSMGTFTGSTIVLSPSATACYTVMGTNVFGCTGFAAGCVSVTPGSTVSIGGNASICGGSSTFLYGIGGTSYTWMPGGSNSQSIVVSPSVSTCYTLFAQTCSGISSAVKCVTVGTTPAISVSGNTAICAGNGATLTASGATSYTWYTSMGTFTGSTIVLTPSTTTCYSLMASSGAGCNGYYFGCISVAPINNLVITGVSSLCSGSSATLSASGAVSYTWLPGNLTGSSIVISPTASICYTLVGTNSNGCVSLANKCVQVIPKPTITTNGGVYCPGNTATLTAQGASSYTWLPFNMVGSSIVVSPSVSMCYTVIGSNANGCTNFAVNCLSVMPVPVITVLGNDSICSGASTTLTAVGASSYTWLPSNTNGSNLVVSPSSSTCYSVLGSNAFGCTSGALKCVNVQQGAFLNVSGPNSICAGSVANLLAYGASTYTWNTGSNSPFLTVSPSSSTCYTVTGTTSQGCIGSAVKCLSVQPSPNVSISMSNNDSIICAGTMVYLAASGASSYTWSTGSISSTIAVSPSVTTSYSVFGLNNQTGCSNIGVITLSVDACTGLSKNTNDLQINMYPNPSSGQLTLQGDGINTITYSVYDVIGRELVKDTFTDTKEVDLSQYANGSYLVRFEMGSSVTYKKLILENK